MLLTDDDGGMGRSGLFSETAGPVDQGLWFVGRSEESGSGGVLGGRWIGQLKGGWGEGKEVLVAG